MLSKMIVLLVGLPGSGKSTWTNGLLRREPFQVVCRDDLRAAFGVDGHNTQGLDPKIEAQVAGIANAMLRAFLVRGLDVVLDETHTSIQNIAAVLAVAKKHDYSVHVMYFPLTPDESKARRPGIPAAAIDRMASNLLDTFPYLEKCAERGDIASYVEYKG